MATTLQTRTTKALRTAAADRRATSALQRIETINVFVMDLLQGRERILSRHRILYGSEPPFWTRKKRKESLHNLTVLTDCADLTTVVLDLLKQGLITVEELDAFLARTPLALVLRDKFLAARKQYQEQDPTEQLLALLADPTYWSWPGRWETLDDAATDGTLTTLHDTGRIDDATWRALIDSHFVEEKKLVSAANN